MKISLNWLKEYITLEESPEKIGQRLTDTGLEVEGIEVIEPVAGGLAGLVIGEVLECGKHPNADKLSLTRVDTGDGEPVQIVCGAPNVAAGQKVVVATVGSTIHPAGGEPFTIKKAKIRGEVSLGMICAEDEIGIGESHDGILVLETALPNGTPAAAYFKLESDHVFEIGLTPNRADAASHIGVARDLSAVLNRPVNWPDISAFPATNEAAPITVEVKDKVACPRYSGVTIDKVSVGPSPEWLQRRLRAIGLTPINNIVDCTNFVLHELGQPLHAFDAAAITGGKVIVQTLPEGTSFVTLDDRERTLRAGDLMICNGAGEGMCIAGVFGGSRSGVTGTTTRVFLESAYFSADSIRKTAQHHKLKTDASFRYERGTDPEITVTALKRAALLIRELAGGTITGEVIDEYPQPVAPFRVKVSYAHIHRLIGVELKKQTIRDILEALEIALTEETEEGFTAVVPPYRVDVTREADVIEEILRIYGFNQIPLPESVASDYLAEFDEVTPDGIQKTVSSLLAANGFYEVITNSLTRQADAEEAAFLDAGESVVILNRLSEDLGVMRQTLLFSLLEVAQHNINRKQTGLKLFEFGKEYHQQGGKYIEKRRLALLLTGEVVPENWQIPVREAGFHDLSGVVRLVLERITTGTVTGEVTGGAPYGQALMLLVDGREAGRLGKVETGILRKKGIKQDIFYADIDWDLLLRISSNNIVYREVPKFPEVRRDLSLVIDRQVSFNEIRKVAQRNESRLLKEMKVFDVYEGDKIGKDQKAYAIHFTLQDETQTLTDKVIDKTMTRLMSAFEKELNAIIRK